MDVEINFDESVCEESRQEAQALAGEHKITDQLGISMLLEYARLDTLERRYFKTVSKTALVVTPQGRPKAHPFTALLRDCTAKKLGILRALAGRRRKATKGATDTDKTLCHCFGHLHACPEDFYDETT